MTSATERAAPVFFGSPKELRDWLDPNHASARELWVGYHKKHTRVPSLTWAQSVDEALCVGWIDGVRKSIDADRYEIRFTPRKSASNWSAVNIARVAELTAEGRMRPAGLAAFEARTAARSGIYSYENQPQSLDADDERVFREAPDAWRFFEAQPPSYRRTAIWWVVSAKKAETRVRRLATLVDCSARGERLPHLTPLPRKST